MQGAPVMLAPVVDNPALGADPTRNNDFTYGALGQTTGKSNTTDQSKYVAIQISTVLTWHLFLNTKMSVLCAHPEDAAAC
jgi:hypothetical protein